MELFFGAPATAATSALPLLPPPTAERKPLKPRYTSPSLPLLLFRLSSSSVAAAAAAAGGSFPSPAPYTKSPPGCRVSGMPRCLPRTTTSEDTSTTVTEKLGKAVPSGAGEEEEEEEEATTTTTIAAAAAATNDDAPYKTPEPVSEEAPAAEQAEATDFFSQLNLSLDSEDAYSILVYGTGAFVALWTCSAIVGSIDSLPLFPKVMEIVGLGFTVWFTYRYLIFKRNRDELFAKIEDLKEQILGPADD